MSVLRCPVCKADNTQGPTCRRCKAELALLFELEAARQRLLAKARDLALAGRWGEFLERVLLAHGLRHDEETSRLLAAGRLRSQRREESRT
jgi:hypothetical protein